MKQMRRSLPNWISAGAGELAPELRSTLERLTPGDEISVLVDMEPRDAPVRLEFGSRPVRLFRGADKETNGSPKFPGYLCKPMPRSSTPVVS